MEIFTRISTSSIIDIVVDLSRNMEIVHYIIRLSYVRISQNIQAELILLSTLSELTDNEQFRQSVAEVIYQLNDLSDAIDLQRRYLKNRT
jgi:hypothetical protein